MTETELQELYIQFKQNPVNSNIRKKCKEKLHYIVYSYPAKRFRADFDTASDFYLYFYPKIDEILIKYDPERKVSLQAYLSVQLRLNYYKFIGKRNADGDRKMNQTLYGWDEEIGLQISDDRENEHKTQAGPWKKFNDLIAKAFHLLSQDEEIRVRLYHGFTLLGNKG